MKHMNALFRAVAVPAALVAGLSLAPGMAIASPTDGETAGILITLDEETSRALAAQAEGGIQLLSEEPVMGDLAQAGVEVSESSVSHDGDIVLAADAGEGMSDAEALEAARGIDGVAEVQYNFVYHLIDFVDESLLDDGASANNGINLQAALNVNDPIAQVSSSLATPNQYWAYNAHLTDAWAKTSSDHTATVAMLDSGAELDHEDLADNVLLDLAWDETDDTLLKDCEIQDSAGNRHGTMTAGVVAATANNALGIAGASYNANVLPIKVVQDDGSIESIDICDAYDYLFELIDAKKCDNLRVINMSLGSYTSLGEDSALHKQIKKALDEYDILTVCSGGNKGISTPNYPSDLEECVAVTSLNADGSHAEFSDYNSAKDISAPGARIFSTGANSGYTSENGTSLSAPMVSGTIALMYAACPDATPEDILEALYATADPIAGTSGDHTPNGSHGALNAAEAVDYLVEHTGSDTPDDPDTPEEPSAPFTDVPSDAWFYSAVEFAYDNKIMHGYTGTTLFGPYNPVTRQDAACVLYNIYGNGEIAADCGLPDVKEDYYTDAVNWAVAHGVIKGYFDSATNTYTSFGVGDSLTREQLACIVVNMAATESGLDISKADSSKYNKLPDHDKTSSWATESLIWAVDNGIINGIEQSGRRILAPQNTTSRAELAAIMMNCIQKGILNPNLANASF